MIIYIIIYIDVYIYVDIYIYMCVCGCVCVWHMTYMFLNSAKSMCMFFGHDSSSHDHRMPKAPHGAVTSRHFARQVLYSKYMAPAEERLQLLENDSQAQEAHLWILGCPCDFAYAWVSVVHCSLQWICGDSIRYMRFLLLPFFIDIFVTHCDWLKFHNLYQEFSDWCIGQDPGKESGEESHGPSSEIL